MAHGDLVILPAYTFIGSANAAALCGASPWLLDVSSQGWTLDPEALANALSSETERRSDGLYHRPTGRRVAAVIPVYTLGTPADIDPIREKACEYGLPVIADAAAALGAKYKGRDLTGLADLTVFSFNGNKTFTCGGGGAVVGDPDLVGLVRHLSTTAKVGAEYHHDRIGFNYRLTNIQAAVGCAQLERLDDFLAAKKRIREVYNDFARTRKGLGTIPEPSWADSARWFSGLTLDETAPPLAEVCQQLSAAGLESRPFWKPLHLQPPYLDSPQDPAPVSEKIWQTFLALPSSTGLTDSDLDLVTRALERIFP